MIKGGFINVNPIEGYNPILNKDLWNEKENKFEITNWNNPQVIIAISKKICEKKQDLIKKISEYKKILFEFVKYFDKTKKEISDNQITDFFKLFNKYLNPFKIIINSSAYDKYKEIDQNEINIKCNQILNSIDITLDENFFSNFRQKAKNDKKMFNELNKLIGDLDKIKNYQEEINNLKKIEEEEKIYFDYYEKRDLKTFVEKDLEIKKDIKNELLKLTQEYSFDKYIDLYNKMMPINLYDFNQLIIVLTNINLPNTNIQIVKEGNYKKDGIDTKFIFELYDNKLTDIDQQITYEFNSKNFSIKKINFYGYEEYIEKKNNIFMYPYIKKKDITNGEKYSMEEKMLITGMIISKKKKSLIISNYYLEIFDKYYTSFMGSFLGTPIPNDFVYFKDYRSLFLAFVYSADLKSLIEIFMDSKDKIFNLSIDDEKFDNLININKVLDDEFLKKYKDFDNKEKSLLNKLNEIYPNNLKFNELYKFIYSKISKEIVVYYNYIIQQYIVKNEENQIDDVEQNIKKFKVNIDKLNNSILYCFDIVKDYIVVKLIIGCVYYNILLKYISYELILGLVYSLIVNYITNDYDSISNIVNIFNINYNLVGYYDTNKNNINTTDVNNFLYTLEKAFPTYSTPPFFDYQFVEKIKIQGKEEIYPCVEMLILNFMIYLIYGDEKIKDMYSPLDKSKKIILNEINPELLPVSTKQELKNFFIKSNVDGNIIYYTKNEIIEMSKDDRLQKYYKAIHNILSIEQMTKLNNFLISNGKFKYNSFYPQLDSYYITVNVKDQNELPGRYSFLCLILSKIFGLEGKYSTDELLKEENFSKFYDFDKDKTLNEYPNDTLLNIFKLFSTYQYKFEDDNFTLKNERYGLKVKIINKDINTWLAPGHGHFAYVNHAESDISSLNYCKRILVFEFKGNLINYSFFNGISHNLLLDDNTLYYHSLDNYKYTYNKNLFDKIAVELTINPDIHEHFYKIMVLELLKNYNTDYKVEYLNLFSNIYYKYYGNFEMSNEIMDVFLNKIVSIDFDNTIKYPINKFEKCWLSIEDIQNNIINGISTINGNPIISIENYKKKHENNIKTSYILLTDFFDIIKVIDFIDNGIDYINDEFLFDDPLYLYLLLLLNNDVDKSILKKIIKKIIVSRSDENYILYILKLVYMYKLFSLKNYKNLIDIIIENKINDFKIDVKYSFIVMVVIMFMPYIFNDDISKYISIEEKTELKKINVLSFISELIEKIKKNYDDTENIFYGDMIHKIYNTDILKNIFENNFDLNNQPNYYKFVKYNVKGNSYPKINQLIFNIEGTKKLELRGKKYINYIKYLYILNNVQSEIIGLKLMDAFTLTMGVYNSNVNFNYLDLMIKKLYKRIYTNNFFDHEHALMGKINYDYAIVLGSKNLYQEFGELDTNYKIIYSYQKIMTDVVNDILFQEKFAENIFNFHYVIYETFRDVGNKYIDNILTIDELFGNNNLSSVDKFNFGENFISEFKENFMIDIKLVYKGGNVMKITFEKYNKLFAKNKQLNNFFEKFKNAFIRSDADYIILINKKNIRIKYSILEEKDLDMIYNLYYYHLNFIVNILINKLRNDYNSHISFYYDFNMVNYTDLDNSLVKLNEKLEINNTMYPESNYSKIKKFIGINFYNRNYIKEQIDNTKKLYIFENNELIETVNRNSLVKDTKFLNKEPSPKRKDIFITYKNKDDLPQDFINKFKHKINDNDKYLLLEMSTGDGKNDIYIITNESHQYRTWNNQLINFTLHRLKLNSLLYFSIDVGEEERYGYMNNPVELLDISIPKYNDFFNTDLFDIEENIEENVYLHPYVGKFKYYTYNSKGYIKDLYLNLCVHNKYIWDDTKYEKRLNRLIFFIIIELISIENYAQVIGDICDFLNDMSKINLDKFKSKININIYKFFETILSYKNDLDYNNFKNQYEKMIHIIKEKFDEFIKVKDYDKIKSPTKEELDEIKYFNKYIKYKNKYSLLKNKLGI